MYRTHDSAWHKKRQEQQRRDHMCTGKIKHRHMGTALQHAVSLRKKSPGAHISMYDCEFCPFIHVGNNRKDKTLTEYHET